MDSMKLKKAISQNLAFKRAIEAQRQGICKSERQRRISKNTHYLQIIMMGKITRFKKGPSNQKTKTDNKNQRPIFRYLAYHFYLSLLKDKESLKFQTRINNCRFFSPEYLLILLQSDALRQAP